MKENRIAALPLGKNLTDSCAEECQFSSDTFLLDEKKILCTTAFLILFFQTLVAGSVWLSLT